MKNIIFILATSLIILTGCGGDTTAVAANTAAPTDGNGIPSGVNTVPTNQ
jgi:hypothetical protein|tara:strand:+ start:898 stop:1047 length:150 start_codon:yes stop_codon:yes gene_type:complete